MAGKIILVKMGEMAVVNDNNDEEVILKTTLGSCIGIILMDRKNHVSGLSHIMLPRMMKNDPAVGKYADTAIPLLIKKMKNAGANVNEVKSYIIGGANMFGSSSQLLNIGKKNYDAVREILKINNIPIIYEDVGGTSGRTVIYNHNTGEVEVKKLNAFKKSKPKQKVEVVR